MDKNKFFEYFMNASIEEQVEIFNGLKKAFESVLQSRSAETEKHLFYLKDIYKAHFDNKPTPKTPTEPKWEKDKSVCSTRY
jgi:hypothetical protein